MRIDLRDRELLAGLTPMEMAAYLRSRGWHENASNSREWASFTFGGEYEVSLPLSTDLRDFPFRISDALRTLAIVENRDQLEIFSDLKASASDIIRVRLADTDARDGSLPLHRAAEVVARSYDMMLAAACAAVDPRFYFPSRKPQAATDYMRNVRMGQTERGSFVVSIISHVTPALSGGAIQGAVPEPFERTVTERLSDSLGAINNSARLAVATEDINAFDASVAKGVSANLCDAISGLSSADGTERDVEVSLAWARVRPSTKAPFLRYRIGRDIVPVLREVARVFKTRTPQADFEVRGPVFRLVRDPPAASHGEVTIAGFVDGAPRSIWLHLEGNDYVNAADAFKNQRVISVTGVLKKEGRRYRLYHPQNFRLVPSEED